MSEMHWHADLFNFKLYWALSYFSYHNYWMYFDFCFCFFAGVPIGVTGSRIWLKIYAITAGIKGYKSITEKKKKKHGKIVLLAKSKLNSITVLISETLINLVISHAEFISTKILRLNQGYLRF